MKNYAAIVLLFLVGCLAGCQQTTSNTPPPATNTAPVISPRGALNITFTFINEPSSNAVAVMRRGGAVQTASTKVWTLDNYDFQNALQGDAVHAALAERAKVSLTR